MSFSKNLNRTLALLLVGVFAAAMLTACQSQPAPSQQPEQQGSQKETGDYPFTLDNYGRQVEIKGRPQKALTLGPNCTELFVALGLQDAIVGRSLVNHSRGPLPEYEAAFEQIPQLNYGSATREAVLSSGADFIYALDWEIGGGVNPEEVENYGMTVYVNSAITLEQQYQEILDLGRIFGVEQTAEEFVTQQKSRIQAVKDKIGDRQPLKVLVYDSGNDGVFTCSGINFESLLISLAGGENLFNDLDEKQWVTVSYEEVLARQPDVILIHDYDSPSVEQKILEIQSNPTLAQLDCVKNGRFATITLESVLPGDRMAFAVESMAKDFYPDLFA